MFCALCNFTSHIKVVNIGAALQAQSMRNFLKTTWMLYWILEKLLLQQFLILFSVSVPQDIVKPAYLGCGIYQDGIPNIQSLLAPHEQINKQVPKSDHGKEILDLNLFSAQFEKRTSFSWPIFPFC